MAIFQAIFAFVARQIGRLLNTAFGWATIMIFGKVPEDRQKYLSVMALGSVAWIVVVLGIAFPAFATWLLSFVNKPDWVQDHWIRIAMLVAAVLIPLIIGCVSLLLKDPEDRPQGAGDKAKMVLKRYPFTLGLSITLIMMTVFAPVLKVRTILKRWTTQHVPVIVEPDDYMEVVGEIRKALATAGWKTEREQANWLMRAATKVLTTLAGGGVKNLVADNLTILRSDQLEVMLHPADLVINGKEYDVVHSRATLVEQLAFSKAYLTWDKDGNELEDRLRHLWNQLRARADGSLDPSVTVKLQTIERDLRMVEVPCEEWEVLFRQKLLVERGLLQVLAGVAERPREPAEVGVQRTGAEAILATTRRSSPVPHIPRVAAVALGLLALLGVSRRRQLRS
jgi:hypothetical protein